MRPSLILAALLCVTQLAACTSSSVIPVARHPDPSLLLPCDPPVLSDPETATDNDFAADMLRLGEAYVACSARHDSLVKFEKAQP